jgi:hypothetical protein
MRSRVGLTGASEESLLNSSASSPGSLQSTVASSQVVEGHHLEFSGTALVL